MKYLKIFIIFFTTKLIFGNDNLNFNGIVGSRVNYLRKTTIDPLADINLEMNNMKFRIYPPTSSFVFKINKVITLTPLVSYYFNEKSFYEDEKYIKSFDPQLKINLFFSKNWEASFLFKKVISKNVNGIIINILIPFEYDLIFKTNFYFNTELEGGDHKFASSYYKVKSGLFFMTNYIGFKRSFYEDYLLKFEYRQVDKLDQGNNVIKEYDKTSSYFKWEILYVF